VAETRWLPSGSVASALTYFHQFVSQVAAPFCHPTEMQESAAQSKKNFLFI